MPARDTAPFERAPAEEGSPGGDTASREDAGLPWISIIVPTYQRPRELAVCLAALAALDYPVDRYEVVVVDDGSEPPATPSGANARRDLRVTWLRQPNRGPSAARNLGARHACGEVLAFTDDDCAPARGWLRALAASVRVAPGALHGGTVVNGLAHNAWAVASQTITDVVVPSLLASVSPLRFVTSNNLALRAERFAAIGGFDEGFRASEDREFAHRWLASGAPIAEVPGAVVHHLHDLGLVSYWRQHFGYGRGAYAFHRRRAVQVRAPFNPNLGLVAETFRRPFATLPMRSALRIAALLVVWQVANAAGYLWQGIVGDRSHAKPPS